MKKNDNINEKYLHEILKLLRIVCDENWYEFKIIDNFWWQLVKIVSWNNFFFSSIPNVWFYPLNTNFASWLLKDKARTYLILKQNNIEIPFWDYFFLNNFSKHKRPTWKEIKDWIKFANNLWFPVFVKPNSLFGGELCEVVFNENQLKKTLQKISKRSYIWIIQEYLDLDEYRIFCIQWNIEFIYKKSPFYIIWDWKNNIETLLKLALKQWKKINKQLLEYKLKKNNLKIENILKLWDKLKIWSVSNLKNDWIIEYFEEDIPEILKKYVKNLINLFKIDVCWIDIFVKNWLNNPNWFKIIEINWNPNFESIIETWKIEQSKNIWKKILDIYFKWSIQK